MHNASAGTVGYDPILEYLALDYEGLVFDQEKERDFQ